MLEKLLTDIEAYCNATGISPSTLGLRSVNDGKLYARLKSGRQCLPRTEEKVRAFMVAQDAESTPVANVTENS